MPAEGLSQDASILAERLAMSSVVFGLHHAEEPPELVEGGFEPFVVAQQDFGAAVAFLVGTPKRLNPSIGFDPVAADGTFDGGHRRPDVGKRIRFEQNEIVGPSFEPIDEQVEFDGGRTNVDLRPGKRHHPSL